MFLTGFHSKKTGARLTNFFDVSPLLSQQGFYLKLSYLLLQAVDMVLTMHAVNSGAMELNPVMRSLISSPFQMVTVKLVVPLIIVLLVPGKWLLPAILFLVCVAAWNLKELFMLF